MNLASLANVRLWVGSQVTDDDQLLLRLISESSRTALNYMQRADIALTTITEVINGRGTAKVQLRNWPVIAVNSLSINGTSIPASTGPTVPGYLLEVVYGSVAGRPQNVGIVGGGNYIGPGVALNGYNAAFAPGYGGYNNGCRPFPYGVGNISVGYSYGYSTKNEAATVPGTPYQVAPLNGSCVQDLGVTYANTGVALTPVAANPSVGQYVPPSITSSASQAYYQFAAADTNAAVLLNYNYSPFDLEQAVIEMVGERYRYRSRIGAASQTLGGQETTSYLVHDALTASIKARLEPYKLAWGG